jgi:TRAP-type mannitol/chloroaromatic compound transport system substrate-binding protein
MKLGLHKTGRDYDYPGWHKPGTVRSRDVQSQVKPTDG